MPSAENRHNFDRSAIATDPILFGPMTANPVEDLGAGPADILSVLGGLTGADSIEVLTGDVTGSARTVAYSWGQYPIDENFANEFQVQFTIDEVTCGQLVARARYSTLHWSDTADGIVRSLAAMLQMASSRTIVEAKLTRSLRELQTIFEEAPIALVLVDRNGRILRANEQSTNVLHKHPVDVEGTVITKFIFSEDLPPLQKMWEDIVAAASGVRTINELRLVTPDGQRWHRAGCTVTRSASGDLIYVTIDLVDIDDNRQLAYEHDRTQRSLGNLIDNLPDSVLKMDPDFNVVFSNPEARRLRDWTLSGDGPMSVTGWPEPPPDEIDDYLEAMWCSVRDSSPASFEHTLGPRDDRRWYETSFVPEIGPDGYTESVLFVTRDIHERRLQQDRLAHRLTHDALTGLPNRELFLTKLAEANNQLESAGIVNGPKGLAVLFFDLDRFKVINDSLGHIVGDQLLIGVAERLRAVVRPGDVVSRLGSDEFTILVHETDPAGALALAERINESIRQPIEVEGRQFILSASMGVVVTVVPESATDLLRWADAAMYRAKEQGRNCVALFDERLRTELTEHLELDQLLRRSLTNGELSLNYQPEVYLGSGRIIGAEALVRWQHPTRGLIAAGDFVPLAEDNGMIVPIGQWVLETACAQVMDWRENGTVDPSFILRVNLSTRQLAIPSLVEDIDRVLSETGYPAGRLCLEVTETALMRNVDHSLEVLNELSSLGLSLAVDDFGTGYSSLSTLKQFPLKVLKIDMSFVDGLPADSDDMAIVSTIILLADSLGLTTTAEGVEHEGQRQALLELGCTTAQGYMFSRPVPAADFAELLGLGTALPIR